MTKDGIPKPADVNEENVIPMTMEDLSDEQKQAIEGKLEEYKKGCLNSFVVTKRGQAVQKTALPEPHNITITEDTSKFQETFDQAMHHAMINQSNVLKNMIYNTIVDTMGGTLGLHGHKGPTFLTETSATGAARGGMMASTGVGNYSPPPYLHESNLAQQLGTSQVVTSTTTTPPLIASSAMKNLFPVSEGFIPDPNPGMPRSFMSSSEVPTSAGSGSSTQALQKNYQAPQPMNL
jgi:hypothetical protein